MGDLEEVGLEGACRSYPHLTYKYKQNKQLLVDSFSMVFYNVSETDTA